MFQQEAESEHLRDHAVATVECDVPVGWSLQDWRAVRGLAREATTELEVSWWHRVLRRRHTENRSH
jgi:hypothetical protein